VKLSIVLSTHAAAFEAVAFKGDFEANVAKIAGWGYDGVELAVRDPALVDAGELESVIAKHGLEVPAIGTGQAWGEEGLSFTSDDPEIRAAAIERIESHISLAERLNAVVILGLIRGITPEGQNHDQSMAYLVHAIRRCAETAKGTSVHFALEPMNRYETDLVHSAAEGLELVEKVGADNFGLLLDTFHMNIEEPDICTSIRECGDRIFHFHVADSNRWHPGAGHLDFGSILDELEGVGYAGFVSGEFVPMPDSDTAAQNAVVHLRNL
jgi:sugar phosphate isomerase/epimerase